MLRAFAGSFICPTLKLLFCTARTFLMTEAERITANLRLDTGIGLATDDGVFADERAVPILKRPAVIKSQLRKIDAAQDHYFDTG
jgi:hypothetical protein